MKNFTPPQPKFYFRQKGGRNHPKSGKNSPNLELAKPFRETYLGEKQEVRKKNQHSYILFKFSGTKPQTKNNAELNS